MKAERKVNPPGALPPLTDAMIESGEDLSAYMGDAHAAPAMFEPQKVNVDFPAWVVQALDREADRIGVARQSLIKMWIAERLEGSPVGVSLSELREFASARAEEMQKSGSSFFQRERDAVLRLEKKSTKVVGATLAPRSGKSGQVVASAHRPKRRIHREA